MPLVQVTPQSPANLLVKVNDLSYLAFLNLVTKNQIQTLKITPKETFYFGDEVKDFMYSNIIDELKVLTDQADLLEILPFAQMRQLEFSLAETGLGRLISKLLSEPLIELKNLGAAIAKEMEITPQPLPAQSFVYEPTICNIKGSHVALLDLDRSIENKIIFYHLYQGGNNEVNNITAKIELMTLEQKENFLEQVFLTSPLHRLPNIINNSNFCTFEIIDEFVNLKPLLENPEIHITLQNPTTCYGYAKPEQIVSSANHEAYLSLMEKIRLYVADKRNLYIIPQIFRQQALISIDLRSLAALKTVKTPVKEKLFEPLGKQLPFLTNYLNK